MATQIPLAADFPAPDHERWRTLAEKVAGKAGWDGLTAVTADGLVIAPVYSATASKGGIVMGRNGPWDIRQVVEQRDVGKANADLLAELNGGATSIELRIAHGASRGVQIQDADDLARALDGMMLDLAPLALDAGGDEAAARLLSSYAGKRGAKESPLAFNVDPFASLLVGKTPTLASALDFAKEVHREFHEATALRIDVRAVHEAGGGEVQELAFLLAVGVALLRAGEARGLPAAEASATILFTMAVGSDVVIEISKLRAARLLWARMLEACGVKAPMRLHVFTGRRMMAKTDVWTNMLRVTAAAFAAGAGGADAITTLALSEALGKPTPFTNRIARNTQLLLQEEAHVAKVADPGAGSFAIESLTDEMARAAWSLFQQIEKRGGVVSAMDWFAHEVAKSASFRLASVRDKTAPIVGVSVFPPTDEKPFITEPWPETPRPPVLPAMRLSETFEAAP